MTTTVIMCIYGAGYIVALLLFLLWHKGRSKRKGYTITLLDLTVGCIIPCLSWVGVLGIILALGDDIVIWKKK